MGLGKVGESECSVRLGRGKVEGGGEPVGAGHHGGDPARGEQGAGHAVREEGAGDPLPAALPGGQPGALVVGARLQGVEVHRPPLGEGTSHLHVPMFKI